MDFVNANGIKKDSDFRKVYKTGKSFANRLLVMYVVKNNLDINRVGFSVSKKIGKAVVRNKVKRRMRESFRLYTNENNLKVGYDFVFIARMPISESDFMSTQKSMIHLFKKANIVKR
ncbi:ribonuclease P protein component [Tepidibacter aestuarii]|uniref:ribonuclease P protein component n=1 Tax=Tepidibacter aestuarii TaxID=2925782 RepID=UPI002ED259FC|nr:protein component of ribonuclease P (RNase P) (substrate specificity) [Tepidibacter aestuarii]